MLGNVKISIIVSIYKVEKYIHTCVKSLINQSYKNYEIILVDDGSPDNCPSICNEYASNYDFIKVVHKKNGGLSDARNYGLNYAIGEYVTFVDSDDYVSEDYLEVLVGLKEKYNADICVGGLCTFFEGEVPNPSKRIKDACFTGLEALEHMLYQNMLDSSACAMILPLTIAKKNLFPVGKYHEDDFTTYKYYTSVNKVAVTTKSVYFYLQRRGSIMHAFGRASLDELDAADNLVSICKSKWPQLVKAAYSKKFSDYCQVLLSTDEKELRKFHVYTRISSFLNCYKQKMVFDCKARVKNRIAAIILLLGEKYLRTIKKLL